MITNLKELCQQLLIEIEGKEPEQIKAEAATSGTRLNTLRRITRRYHRAADAAKGLGFIGVGTVSFAEIRMVEFQRRANIG